jgi:protein phosphatase
MLRISGTGASHVGLVRENNEDAGFVGPTCMLVADGVGGGAAGEVAAATAAYVVAATALLQADRDPVTVLHAGVALAQQQLAHGVAMEAGRAGMATTLTALMTDGRSFALAHIGDSRGYVFRNGGLTRVTRDHTYVQDLVEAGSLEEADVPMHPWRNVVMRSVNGSVGERADVRALSLAPGDRVLIASDGVTDLVAEPWIEEILARKQDDAAVESLIAAALGQGGRDNITCVLATVIDGPPVSGDGRLLGALADHTNVVDLAAVRALDSA